MIDVMSETGWDGVGKEAIFQSIRNNPSLIWDLSEVDKESFSIAIEADPTSLFDEWGEVHAQFSLEKYSELVDRVVELIANCSIESVTDKCCMQEVAASKDWRILSLLPNAEERVLLAALKCDSRALDLIPELTPALQLVALDDPDGRDRVFFRCGKLTGAVERKAKQILLNMCRVCPNPNWGYPYAEKYLSLANEHEAKEFLSDYWLSELVCLNEFFDEPSDKVKKFLINWYGYAFYQLNSPDCWSYSDELMEWVLEMYPELIE